MTRMPAAARREQLLDTAVSLFAERGFGGATTAELAKAAGVTEPIIYRHFRSKKDLFIAVIQRAGRLTLDLWEHQLRDTDDPATRLKRLVTANPMITHKGAGVYRVIVQAMTAVEDADILEALRQHIVTLHDFVQKEVEYAQEQGQVSKGMSPSITAWMLLHLGLGYGLMAPLGIDGHATDERGKRVRDVVLNLMLGERAKQLQDQWAKEEGTGH
ncbi:MAG: TetR/AcrR family transcriptional regulator [Phycisphaerales bacterium]|nr:TetR/AcrR family transcriptional regulator [Phycisphaerales bacterium]